MNKIILKDVLALRRQIWLGAEFGRAIDKWNNVGWSAIQTLRFWC